MSKSQQLQSYIGTRDFFPKDQLFRNWMFHMQKRMCLNYGYSEYATPLLESIELYKAKSSDEIVGDQIYKFLDRGDREIAIRPELTPSLARMLSNHIREFPKPIRWYNVSNFMRYERPGHGRLREFFQLNVDLVGSNDIYADLEILMLAIDLLQSYGATHEHFVVYYSNRKLLDAILEETQFKNLKEKKREVIRLIDKKNKIGQEKFEKSLREMCDRDTFALLMDFLSLKESQLHDFSARLDSQRQNFLEGVKFLETLGSLLLEHGYEKTTAFEPTMIRGFDYYTSFIFEAYDRDSKNARALLGGGRYDKLLGLFAKDDVPALGFGLGDVTLENFIRLHNLVPSHLYERKGGYLIAFDQSLRKEASHLAKKLRQEGFLIEESLAPRPKVAKEIELANKKNREFVILFGSDEAAQGIFKLKDLATGKQESLNTNELIAYLHERRVTC